MTEFLFANQNGELNQNISLEEANYIYMAYMQSLVDSYDQLKLKFNLFQTKLSDKNSTII